MNPPPEQRRFARIPFDAMARLSNGAGVWHSQVVDTSLKGLLIRRPENWIAAIGEPFLLELILDNHDICIRMEVRVARLDETHVGLRCEHIDLDGIAHLRRLVELNLGDPALLERELAALW
jgi:hypothetical protein